MVASWSLAWIYRGFWPSEPILDLHSSHPPLERAPQFPLGDHASPSSSIWLGRSSPALPRFLGWASEMDAWELCRNLGGRRSFLVGIAERESLYEESWLRGAETPSPENIAWAPGSSPTWIPHIPAFFISCDAISFLCSLNTQCFKLRVLIDISY